MKNKSNEECFIELEDLYKQKGINKKDIKEWILILKIILTGTTAIALGWFIGSIIALKMSCGG